MQQTSSLYKQIIGSRNHWFESALAIGDSGRLITESGDWVNFGALILDGEPVDGQTAILVDTGGAETAFREDVLMSMSTESTVFDENYPTVGSATASQIDVQMLMPVSEIPRMARLVPYVRVTDGERVSEWLQKGVYFVDTRQVTHNDDGLDILTLHGYDAMLKFDVDYPSDDSHDYPLVDTEVVNFLADSISVRVDPRTIERMDKGYMIPLPVGYSSREVLQLIAGSYGGNFVMTDKGELLLIRLCDLPKETNYLIDPAGDVLIFGFDPEDTLEFVRIVV